MIEDYIDEPEDQRSSSRYAYTGEWKDRGYSLYQWEEQPDEDRYTVQNITLEVKACEFIIETMARKLGERLEAGWDVDEIVIGVEQYKLLLPYIHQEFECSPETFVEPYSLTVVPGNLIHIPVDNKRVLHENIHV